MPDRALQDPGLPFTAAAICCPCGKVVAAFPPRAITGCSEHSAYVEIEDGILKISNLGPRGFTYTATIA